MEKLGHLLDRPFPPLLGAKGAQVVELSLVAEAARPGVGQPFPSAERIGWEKGGFLLRSPTTGFQDYRRFRL